MYEYIKCFKGGIMKNIVIIVFIFFLVLLITIIAYSQESPRLDNNIKINEKLVLIEKKIQTLEAKFDEILENQQKILKEINICTIRARR